MILKQTAHAVIAVSTLSYFAQSDAYNALLRSSAAVCLMILCQHFLCHG